MKKVIGFGAVMLAVFVTMTSCTGRTDLSTEKIEGLDALGKIKVVTREEGSGTREVFAEKVKLKNSGNSSNTDEIRSDAQIAINAEAVVQAVANDENAIGYVSLGAATGDLEGIKVLAVNDIMPDGATISNGKYPLSRRFNIAYCGKITAAETDFLTYVLGAGQKIVSDNYTSMREPTSFLSDQSAGRFIISGSTSVAPLMEALVEDYNENYNNKVEIEILMTDSTAGLTAAMQGSSDWGMASRELKDYEKELLTYHTIAKDGVAIIVNAANPITTLTMDQLTQIFNGTDQSWSDINK